MDGGSHASPQVGGAGVDVAVLGVQHEVSTRLRLDRVSHSLDTSGQTIKHSSDVTSALHGDDPQLVLLVDPGEECLVLVVENTTTLGPVSLHTSSDQITIAGDEEEVIVHELLSDLLAHSCERKVGSCQVAGQVGEGLLHEVLHAEPLVLGDPGRETEPVNTASNPDTSRVHRSSSVNVPLDLGDVHVAGVLAVGGDAMVVLDDGVEHVREHLQYKYLSQSDPSCSDCSAL